VIELAASFETDDLKARSSKNPLRILLIIAIENMTEKTGTCTRNATDTTPFIKRSRSIR
jgi:hypothetical protein